MMPSLLPSPVFFSQEVRLFIVLVVFLVFFKSLSLEIATMAGFSVLL